jgi:N-carbamoylputrescine amidase
MVIGLASAKFVNNDINSNLKNCIEFINKAKKYNADIIIFGETYLQGFESLAWNPEKDLKVGIERNSEIMNILRRRCKEQNIAMGIGYIERDGGKLYSSYLVLDKSGEDLINYRRISRGWRIKNADAEVYREGTEYFVFDFTGHKMTAGLCGDFWTDEAIEKLPKDVDMVLWPVFVDYNRLDWETSVFGEYTEQAKKICKNMFYVNSICHEEKSLAHGGAFAVINNELNASLDLGKEDILVVEY